MVIERVRTLCVTVALFTSSLLASRPLAATDSLSLHIQLEKDVFLVGEDIPLDVYLVNQTDRPLQVPQSWWLRRHIQLECRDSKGKPIPYSSQEWLTLRYPLTMRSVPPRNSIFDGKDVVGAFGTSIAEGGCLSGIPSGAYTIRATYCYEGKSPSNELRFTVVEPSGSEKEVLEALQSICHEYEREWETMLLAVPLLEELLRLHPNSVYAPAILSILRRTYQPPKLRDDKKVIEYAKRAVDEYPNSGQSIVALYDIDRLVPTDTIIAYCNQIEKTKAGTRVAFAAHILAIRTRNSKGTPFERK